MTAPTTTRRLLFGYYAGTVLFLAMDYVAGFNLRVAFLDDLPGWRIAYYLFCGACFALIWRFPAWTSVIATVESCINLCGLIIATGTRVMTATDIALGGGEPVTTSEILNFMLAGAVAYVGLTLRGRQAKADLESGKVGF